MILQPNRKEKGPKHFISFVLILAAVSNLAQFLVAGPAFGGMSGVVYGLFGHVWVKCKYDPGDGFFIDSFVAIIMFGFFIALLHRSIRRCCQLGSCVD